MSFQIGDPLSCYLGKVGSVEVVLGHLERILINPQGILLTILPDVLDDLVE